MTTVNQLHSLAEYVGTLVGQQWDIEKAFNGYRVVRNNGSHNVSPYPLES